MQTTRLRELVTANGPFASVYFDDSHDTADAAKLLDLRWREAREELARQGAPEETLDVMETAVRDSAPPVGSSGRALVAAGDHVVLDERLDEPPAQQVARLSDLPYLLPLVEHGEQAPPYVVVVVDHVGADVTAHDEQGRVLEERTVEGSDHPCTRCAAAAGRTATSRPTPTRSPGTTSTRWPSTSARSPARSERSSWCSPVSRRPASN